MNQKNTLKIALVQLNPYVGAIKKNTDKILAEVDQAQQQKADILVTPELSLTGYPPEDLLLRPGFIQKTEQYLETIIAHSRQSIAMIVGYPKLSQGKLYNMAGVIANGELLAEYAKQELPNYSVFDEKRYFSPGTDSCVVNFKNHHLGITICEDIWHDRAVEQSVEAGASLIININASPFHTQKIPERLQVVKDKAKKVDRTVVYVNQVGGQDELVFDGASFVVNPNGEILQQSHCFIEELTIIEAILTSDKLSVVQAGNVQALPSAVIDGVEFDGRYNEIVLGKHAMPEENEAMIYAALVCGLRDYVDKNGFKGVVLGLSGGIDSALTLAIAVDAIGPERVVAIMMPFKYTSDLSKSAAEEQADRLGVQYESVSIEPMYNAFMEQLTPIFAGTEPNTTEENIQARCRGLMLMAYSNKMGHMVLTTGNKSEMAVGYATLYGDMVGGYSAIKDVYKTLVYDLSRYRNRLAEAQGQPELIPDAVISRPPSAELAPDQQDSDSLPPYDVLDGILTLYIEDELSPAEIVGAGYSKEDVNRVAWLVKLNEYKRRQAAPGVRILKKAFGRDRRYPITSGFDNKA